MFCGSRPVVRFASCLLVVLSLAACGVPERAAGQAVTLVGVSSDERDVHAAAVAAAFPALLGTHTAARLVDAAPGDPMPAGLARSIPSLSEQT